MALAQSVIARVTGAAALPCHIRVPLLSALPNHVFRAIAAVADRSFRMALSQVQIIRSLGEALV